MQLPIDRAYCWILIARAWQLADKPLSYRHACDEVRLACQQQWYSVWHERPAPRAGSGNYYYASHPYYYFDSHSRDREAEDKSIVGICDCLVFLAERQMELGDSEGAMQSCLDAARAAEACYSDVSKQFFFLRMQAVAIQAQHTTKIAPQTFALDRFPSQRLL